MTRTLILLRNNLRYYTPHLIFTCLVGSVAFFIYAAGVYIARHM